MAERNKPSAPKTVREKEVLQGTQSAKKPSKPTVKKIKVETLIAVANIFITVIVGIYLAIRNENIQQKLIELQNQIQYATLEVKNNCDTMSVCVISVTNLGPSTATNIRIAFLLNKVSDSWKNDLTDASNIDITLDNPSIQFDITDKYSPVPENNGNSASNTKLVTIKSLPPGGTITVKPFLSTQPYVVDTTIKLKITSNQSHSTENLYGKIFEFINHKFFITTLSVNASCDNCSGTIPKLEYTLSALREISLKNRTTDNGLPFNWEFDVKINSNNSIASPIVLTPSNSDLETSPDTKVSSVGTGIFAQVTSSDGNTPYSEAELNNKHFQIYRIRSEENPDGCGVSIYNTDKVWFSSSANTIFTVNGQEIGKLDISTGKHGFIADWSVKVGDKICAVDYTPSEFYIIFGPDIYYHYDSYSYRGNC